MKTITIRCLSVALVLAFGASAFADPSKNVVSQSKSQRTRKVCYAMISGSAIPQPCDRLSAIPTTASPMTVIGMTPVVRDK